MIKLAVVMGTRPEAIKLMPVVVAARKRAELFSTTVVATSQHREMLAQALGRFDIVPDVDLDIMQPDQDLAAVTTMGLSRLCPLLADLSPDFVLVQGDTTTTLVGALAAYYNRQKVAHVEAGLRTEDKYQPFPEEGNRRLTTHLADLHFAPTERARANLLREGIEDSHVRVTGNTSIDALRLTLVRLGAADAEGRGRKLVLVTVHRRENHGEPLFRIFAAIRRLAESREDLDFLYPVHPNPRVRGVAMDLLGGHPGIRLVDPMTYDEFLLAMRSAHVVLTDSGGVQEEAPALDKPVLVLREKTERQEGVDAGTLRLIGTESDRIVSETLRLLEDPGEYQRMAGARNPYGDGRAAERILESLVRYQTGSGNP